ncbi:MAG: hypothetical protein IJD98_02575 [Oscillospiraceae bacterium]|nr:hypothetical protein [Oscillospiraceae bacterium]
MSERFNACNNENRCLAVAVSSARISPVADAVIILAVSICVVVLRIMMQFV